jgi:hypothetical protein
MKKVTERKTRIFIFSTLLFETLLILRIIQLDTVKNVKASSCKTTVILVRFLKKT